MRIAILSHQAPAGDAIGNSVLDKASFFHDRGAQVRVYVEAPQGIHPRLRPFAQAIDCQGEEAIRFMSDADLLLVEYGHYYPALNLLPLLVGRKPRIVFDYHGVTPPTLWSDHNREALLLGWQHRGIAWCADRVIVHSKFAARELQDACGYPRERILVIPHPVSSVLLQDYGSEIQTSINVRAELGLDQSRIVLFVGRLAPNKRLGVLIRALARLRDVNPPVHLVVVGNTQDIYRQELERCLELARSLQVSERIHVLGHVDEQRLRACYAAAELFVMPSVHEGFCIPVVEAMARGVPVVAAHAGALPETVGDAGLLFAADDDAELAERMHQVLQEGAVKHTSPRRRRGTGYSINEAESSRSGEPSRTAGTARDKQDRLDLDTTYLAQVVGPACETPLQRNDLHERDVPAVPLGSRDLLTPALKSKNANLAFPPEIHRIDQEAPAPRTRRPRVAFVCFRFGPNVIGGAEKSLARMATALQEAGASVEIFSTCTLQEHGWTNELPAGSRIEDGLLTHRFPVDPVDRGRHNAIVRRILEENGDVDAEGEEEFVRQSVHSGTLIETLAARLDEFDAVLTGPYLAGLTYEVCRAFPEKTLLVPCLHDEAVARLKIWRNAYRRVGGILYHSASELTFGEEALGLNHPRSTIIGTWLDSRRVPDPQRGHALAGSASYVVYCGRYSPQKNVPLLLDWFRQFHDCNPGKLVLILTGQGSVPVPNTPWCRNLGFVDDQAKSDLLAGARALVHLSVNESLSLVALEAWACGTPVIAHEDCAVIRDLIQTSGGGAVIANFESLDRTLLDLVDQPAHWSELGQNARAFVGREYASKAKFTERLLDAVFSLSVPIAEIMKQRGRHRAARHSLQAWRECFGRAIEETLDAPPLQFRESWQVEPHRPSTLATCLQETAFIPIRLGNLGSHSALPDGPGARVLVASTIDAAQPEKAPLGAVTKLPGVIVPGQHAAIVVRVAVPETPGRYRVEIRCQNRVEKTMQGPPDAVVDLVVTAAEDPVAGSCGPLLQAAGAALAEADRRQELPDDYVDVTQGRLASVKLRIKQKLLGNFKHAYVDVLSRRQSAFNRALLEAVQHALESCALLDHAVSTSAPRRLDQVSEDLIQSIERVVADGSAGEIAAVVKDLLQEVMASRDRQDSLEQRIAALEQAVRGGELSPALDGSGE